MVTHKITWLYELKYTAVGQPTVYNELSIVLFISSYLPVIEFEKQSLWPLMACHLPPESCTAGHWYEHTMPCGSDRWRKVGQSEAIQRPNSSSFHSTLVWHPAVPTTKGRLSHNPVPQKKATKESPAYNSAVKFQPGELLGPT